MPAKHRKGTYDPLAGARCACDHLVVQHGHRSNAHSCESCWWCGCEAPVLVRDAT